MNVAPVFRGWSVSRPSNITALKKRRFVVGNGRRYTDATAGEPCSAHP